MMDPEDMHSEIIKLEARLLDLEATLKYLGLPIMTRAEIAEEKVKSERKREADALQHYVIIPPEGKR